MLIPKEIILKRFHKIETKDPAKARKLIKQLDYKNDHYLLQCIAMTYIDEAQFDENGKWRYYADGRKLRIAENYIYKAFNLNPKCSFVLWILGKIKTAYGQTEAAILCYKDIIEIGSKRITQGCCKNELDIEVAFAQINDSKFHLYRLYKDSNPSLSKRYLTLYKKGLEKGIFTLYIPLEQFI
jgi:tetratricopeptide (TPR) repeat protein